jgi:hypothetical protein
VFIERARAALDQKDFRQAESYLLRANRPDTMLAYYREMNMWTDALRIAKEYVCFGFWPNFKNRGQKRSDYVKGQNLIRFCQWSEFDQILSRVRI